MTYHEITKKMKDLTMTPSDQSWLDNYLKETGSSHEYGKLVNAYQEREAGRLPKCDTVFDLCRYCWFGFKCGYKGFCNNGFAYSKLEKKHKKLKEGTVIYYDIEKNGYRSFNESQLVEFIQS